VLINPIIWTRTRHFRREYHPTRDNNYLFNPSQLHRITGFLDSFHHPVFQKIENTTFQKLDVFLIRWRGENRSSFRNVVFFIIYNTRRWKKSKNPVILCYTPSSEPFRIYFLVNCLHSHNSPFNSCQLGSLSEWTSERPSPPQAELKLKLFKLHGEMLLYPYHVNSSKCHKIIAFPHTNFNIILIT
jgi:hypothetical protein